LTSTPLDYELSARTLFPGSSSTPTHSHQASRPSLTSRNPAIHNSLDIPLQTLAEILEHGTSSAQHDILVQSPPNINRRRLDDSVDDFGKRRQKVGRVDFGIEKDFRREETFVTNINVVFLYVSASIQRGRTGPYSAGLQERWSLDSCWVMPHRE
jgi:hypothetical protein